MLLSTTAKHALAPVSSIGTWSPAGNSLSVMQRGIAISMVWPKSLLSLLNSGRGRFALRQKVGCQRGRIHIGYRSADRVLATVELLPKQSQ